MSNAAVSQSEPRKPVSAWRKVIAAVLDFIFVFAIAGYVIAYATGNLTDEGFELKGGPAFMLFGAIALYFVAFIKFLGGTPWQRLLRAK
jgi:hypothetical protein